MYTLCIQLTLELPNLYFYSNFVFSTFFTCFPVFDPVFCILWMYTSVYNKYINLLLTLSELENLIFSLVWFSRHLLISFEGWPTQRRGKFEPLWLDSEMLGKEVRRGLKEVHATHKRGDDINIQNKETIKT